MPTSFAPGTDDSGLGQDGTVVDVAWVNVLVAAVNAAINGNKSFGCTPGNTVAAGVTTFMGERGNHATEYNAHNVCSRAGTIKGLQIVCDGPPGAAQTFTFTVRVNGADTGVTCTVSGAAASTASDLSNTQAIAVGQRYCVKAVSSAGASTRSFVGSLVIE